MHELKFQQYGRPPRAGDIWNDRALLPLVLLNQKTEHLLGDLN